MKIFAIRLQQNELPLFLFSARASFLKSVSHITPRSKDNRFALQRTLDKVRLKKIALYLKEKESIIANNIILNFEDTVTFEPVKFNGIESAGFLNIPDTEKCAYILDGQHRLMGFQYLDDTDFDLACVGFLNLSQEKAADIFTIINTTQKPLNKSLLLDIRHYIGKTEKEEKHATEIALNLNNMKHSLLHDKIKISKSDAGFIKLDALVKLIVPFIDLGGVLERNKRSLTIILNYLDVFFSTYSRLHLNTASLTAALSPIFERVIRRGKNIGFTEFSKDELEVILKPVSELIINQDSVRNQTERKKIIRHFLMALPEGDNNRLKEYLL